MTSACHFAFCLSRVLLQAAIRDKPHRMRLSMTPVFSLTPVQLQSASRYPNYCYPPPFHSVAAQCTSMLRIAQVAMLRLTNLASPGRKRCWTAIVLLAVCALTVAVATRYDRCPTAPEDRQRVVAIDQTWTPSLQRLLNNAATWIPPVITAVMLQDPKSYTQVSQPAPAASSILLEKNLYNRPPPSSLP